MPVLSLHTAPAIEPVTLSEVKDYLRIDDGDSDVVISDLIVAARMYAETYTRRPFITQTWRLTLDTFPYSEYGMSQGQFYSQKYPGGAILLPLPPVQSLTSITYLDTLNATTTFSSANYQTDFRSEPCRVATIQGVSWPATYTAMNAVTLIFVCGYGSTPESVPQGIRAAIRMLVSAWYDSCDTGEKPIPMAVQTLLMQHRYMGVA